MFLSSFPEKANIEKLKSMEGEEYSFAFYKNVLYYAYPVEFSGKRRNINIEKILGTQGTARTWLVVDKLIELLTK